MKYFTYKDYIECIHKLRLNAIDILKEEEEKYLVNNQTKEETIYTKCIKKLLEDKKEVANFLNCYLKAENKIIKENLEREIYNDKFVNKDNLNEYVYKLKNRDINFVFKSCYIFDNKLIYSIIDRCINIMRKYAKRNKKNIGIKFPVIIPIIIYHGNSTRILKNMKIQFEKDNRVEIEKITLKYNILKGLEKNLLKKENLDNSNLLKLIKIRRSDNSQKFIQEVDNVNIDFMKLEDSINIIKKY